ncbi:MAG: hypothetical protein ACXU9U_02690 [Parachlamydiaceae bacterium]
MEPISSVPLHVWNVNGFEVRLIESEDSLGYETVNTADLQTVCSAPLDLYGKTKDRIVSYLKECRVIVSEEGKPAFFPICQKWDFENKEVHLLRNPGNGLVWEVFCKSTNSAQFFSSQRTTVASLRCHSATVAIIEKMRAGSFDSIELKQFVNDFKVVRIVNPGTYAQELKELTHLEETAEKMEESRYFDNRQSTAIAATFAASGVFVYQVGQLGTAGAFLGLGALAQLSIAVALVPVSMGVIMTPIIGGVLYTHWRYQTDAENRKAVNAEHRQAFEKKEEPVDIPIFIELEPKLTAPSLMDDRILVSKFTWAVTLVTGPKGASKNHTAIVVEGLANAYFKDTLKDGEYFMHKCEFNPPIMYGFYTMDEYWTHRREGMEKTETWMIFSEKVVEMFKIIAEEKRTNSEKCMQGNPVEHTFLGEKSIFRDGDHSCFSWAEKTLKLLGITVIKLNPGPPDAVVNLPRAYTETFEEHRKRPFTVRI